MSKKYNEIPIAGNIVEPGNAMEYKTGGWRARKPIHRDETCLWIKNGTCGLCWIYCPDNSVKLIEEDGKYSYEYDYDYCKGCGICANQCPTESIHMEDE
ncbi:MAG: 4Fe-4S dicluster-binding protein [Candidatus Thorarchaeota archaeon]